MKRRGNSEGCITKDSRGKWIARLQITKQIPLNTI